MDLTSIKDFPSYDDQNTYFKSNTGQEFVFKIHELGRSGQSPMIIEAQNQCLTHLKKDGIVCPAVVEVPNPYKGDYTLYIEGEGDDNVIYAHDAIYPRIESRHNIPIRGFKHRNKLGRLLVFIGGPMMVDVPQENALMVLLGEYMGRVTHSLQVRYSLYCLIT